MSSWVGVAAVRIRAKAADTISPDRARSPREPSEDEGRSQCPRVARSRAASQRASGPEASDSRGSNANPAASKPQGSCLVRLKPDTTYHTAIELARSSFSPFFLSPGHWRPSRLDGCCSSLYPVRPARWNTRASASSCSISMPATSSSSAFPRGPFRRGSSPKTCVAWRPTREPGVCMSAR